MQNIIIEKPYRFVPPHRGSFWPDFIQKFNLYGQYLKRFEGVTSHEVRNSERLKKSFDAKHGILLAPNHCRMSDPLVLGFLAREVDCHLYSMASWHLFNQGWFKAFAIQLMGGFSIYREGVDRKSLATAVDAMVEAVRPLVLFPEGSTTRTNDHLHALLDGVAFVARSAAKRREKEGLGKTVIHPVGIKYIFKGDIDATVRSVLHEIEHRLGWRTSEELTLLDRVERMGEALFCLEEIRYAGQARSGLDLSTRTSDLIDQILHPLEKEWLRVESQGSVLPRIKALRSRILPEMVEGKLSPDERSRRWLQLEDIYVAQQISCYIPNYLRDFPSVDRLLETVERYEEDLKDSVKFHGNLHVIIDVDHPIVVGTERRPKEGEDPLMTELRQRLESKLKELQGESKRYQGE
ncbi:1-acyl-sn-glycerol-3-phosphate acyltransferase [Bremerella sp. T1]|uniref:1-acyl-sn-glycerol-3-phosphate acyltransferase n=1 Tax=Bremerella sp. TYQ1 TaxID=3119568 RepID=UPI001CCC5B49|nr:1-acyl-sn-glycerol-3-phosphate acyltransferase [Bremerella volcania]UBM38220.1 1-acyl-sn-glycerol-3-phosphate acyltransferase [Bremerella volcania]